MRAQITHNVVKRTLQMFKQRSRTLYISVKGHLFIQYAKVSRFFDVRCGTDNKPQRIVVKATANLVISFFG
ncbi:hypothetical protein D3C74_276470 [compost metagenome]